jgi:hypothetical protein
MQQATDILEREHRTIEKILRVIGVLADELAEDRSNRHDFWLHRDGDLDVADLHG